ncbi:major facilitator superfamily domain-containing protein 2B isoform X1 [Delphinapterus leucas]|uniref:Major facilitator superfamily domain-containing protein 2B isoform X1 n=1 Tax=Delphinapterus leucas TaxID=9749 RepID=A0A2Y9NAU1_DELLE|nr:major facilitator superfamily domain-containing protein 2B isoform X1 [Delphinapterus leucas]
MLRGHGLGLFFFPFSVSLPFKMIWDKLGLRGCWKSLQDIGTSGCFWKSGGWRELLCVCGGLAPVSPPGQRSWSPLILYEGVLRHWRGPQPGGLQRHSLLPATFPARCGPDPCCPGVTCPVWREGVWGSCRPFGWVLHQQKQKDRVWTTHALGAGLHAVHCLGLLLPMVPAPLHQPAWPLVHSPLLPVPGPGNVLPGALHGTDHALDPQPQGAGLGHCVPCKETALPGQVAVSPNATRLYSIAATVVAVTYPVCSSLLCLGVKERPGASARAAGQGLSFLAGLRLTVRHPPYLKLVISFLFISAAVQVEQSYLVLFCAHASRLHDHVQSLVLTILVSAVLSTPMWEWVLQRFGKRMSAFGIFGMVPFAILLAAMPTAPVAYVVAFVSGVSIAVSLLLPWSMLPDVVDEFQLQHQHGPGLETIFYSSYVFFTKLSGAGALGISTLSLDFAGYESGACKQAEQVVVTLKVLIGAMPTCMILIGLCILMVGPTPKVPSRNSSRSLGRRTSYSLA